MRHLSCSLLCIFFSLIVINACQPVQVSDQVNASTEGITPPSNKENPYDYAGKMHNDALEAYFSSPVKISSITGIVQFLNNYVSTHFNRSARLKSTDLPSSDVVRKVLEDKENDFKNVFFNAGVSSDAQIRLKEFYELIIRDKNNPSANYNDLHQRIASFEGRVLDDATLTPEDLRVVLVASSVGRLSLHLWYERSLLESSVGGSGRKSFWAWLVIGICDAAG